jgi:hypothetical protein
MTAIEILYSDGCPNHVAAAGLVREVLADRDVDLREVRVEGPEDAERLRFLGSPTVRVGGRDVEPGADERSDYVLACRVYRTAEGVSGIPDRRWVATALDAAA